MVSELRAAKPPRRRNERSARRTPSTHHTSVCSPEYRAVARGAGLGDSGALALLPLGHGARLLFCFRGGEEKGRVSLSLGGKSVRRRVKQPHTNASYTARHRTRTPAPKSVTQSSDTTFAALRMARTHGSACYARDVRMEEKGTEDAPGGRAYAAQWGYRHANPWMVT